MPTLRSATASRTPASPPSADLGPSVFTTSAAISPQQNILITPKGGKLPGLNRSELDLLRRKQRQLVPNVPSIITSLPTRDHIRNALAATLIFANYEAGTAVSVDSNGWVLTCSHCFGDSEEAMLAGRRKWLLFYTGLAVQIECRYWDSRLDLALAKIVTIESQENMVGHQMSFSSVTLASDAPSTATDIYCIGQPGRDDLESATKRKTKYNLIEVSEGRLHGLVPDADPLDNSEIGTLKHDAWTYWGHSGAPLLRKDDGALVGLHSSWDDQTAMRHGIPLVAIKTFLERHLPKAS